jgi:thiol-disulfide isomerase/thioredoxin
LPLPARVGIALAALIVAFATVSMTAPVAGAAADPRAEPVVVEVFWGDGCGYCEALLDDLDELSTRLTGFEVVTYEVWRNPANRALMEQRAAALGARAEAVPFTIVDGTQSWLGYTAAIGRQIEAAIVAAIGSTDPITDTPAEPPSRPPRR